MGKEGFLTPKEIAKRIKAKGLQKTRWYCQLCEKQCRDANGFKCHMDSESHLQQMRIFKDNSGKVMDQFSRDFDRGMMDIISRRFRTTRVHANVVYTEYIKDPYHVHMNSTKWVTLTAYAQYLGNSGKCRVEESPKGWYLEYIERDPELIARQEKKEKMEVDDQERAMVELEKRAKLAKEMEMTHQKSLKPETNEENSEQTSTTTTTTTTTSTTSNPSAPITVSFAIQNSKKKEITGGQNSLLKEENENQTEKEKESINNNNNSNSTNTNTNTTSLSSGFDPTLTSNSNSNLTTNNLQSMSNNHNINNNNNNQIVDSFNFPPAPPSKKRKAIEEIMAHQESQKEKKNRRDNWICEDIVIKILSKQFADGKYYKRKGTIRKVFDKYVALVKMQESGDMIKVDQAELETVIPQPGGHVRIVNGAYRGEKASLISINADRFCANVKLESGSHLGTTIEVPYEDISKIAAANE